MNIATTSIEGVRIIQKPLFRDNRGTFQEVFNRRDFEAAGLPTEFPQDNVSESYGGVLRGLHIQRENPQGKLVRCLYGQLWDVWVDLRQGSPTLGHWECITLGAHPETAEAVYIPPGLAHGFLCLTDVAILHYKCTTLYDKASDGGVHWNCPEIGIDWPDLGGLPTVSAKDQSLPRLSAYLEQLKERG